MRQVELYAIPQYMTPAPYCVDGIRRLLDIEALSLVVCLRPRQFYLTRLLSEHNYG